MSSGGNFHPTAQLWHCTIGLGHCPPVQNILLSVSAALIALLTPKMTLSLSVLCMSEQQFSTSLCRDDDEVAVFNAQPDNNDSVDDTLSDYEFEAAFASYGVAADTYKQLEEVQSHPPAQLLEDDCQVSTSEQVNIQILKGLNAKCRSVKEQFENELEMVREVSQHNCVEDMLTHFRQQSVADSKLCLLFKGQHAVGNGVLIEVYSVFWDSSVSSYCCQVTR